MELENKSKNKNDSIIIENELDFIKGKRKIYGWYVVFSIIQWFLIQSFWVYYWLVHDLRAFADMSLLLSAICIISIFIPILLVTLTHRKYKILLSYEKLFEKLEKFKDKK